MLISIYVKYDAILTPILLLICLDQNGLHVLSPILGFTFDNLTK